MTWKSSVSAALTRSTGLRLTRESLEERDAALADAARRATRQEARRQSAQAHRKHARLHDDEMREIIKTVRPRTMTSTPKLQALIDATRYVCRHDIPGDIVECGVWRGGSMQAVALTLVGVGVTDRELHLFDTYEGMPPPTEEDVRTRDGKAAEGLLAKHAQDARVWAYAGLDDVRAGMTETPYPDERIHFHVGMVEDTIPEHAPERIALLRLDTDWYNSTKHELEHLYDRLSPGGILIFDDYGDWEGARKATEEWLDASGELLFLAPMGSGRIAVKPLA
jgi:O-methyltransferase